MNIKKRLILLVLIMLTFVPIGAIALRAEISLNHITTAGNGSGSYIPIKDC